MRDRAKDDSTRGAPLGGNVCRRDAARACLKAQHPAPLDVAEGEGRRYRGRQRVKSDAELRAALLERGLLSRTDTRDERGRGPELCGRRGGVQRRPAKAPGRLPFELVARDVTD